MMKYFYMACIVLASLGGFAQSKAIKPLKIGDRCPDVVFTNLVGQSSKSARLSDFKGKAVIIDFWATWCKPCIMAFPENQRLQTKYKDVLKFILVAVDKQKSVKDFYAMNPKLSLISEVIEKKSVNAPIRKLFPFTTIPHYIWLDKDHVVRAITGYGTVTEANVRLLLAGKSPSAEFKDGVSEAAKGSVMKQIDRQLKQSAANPDTLTIFKSLIEKYNPDPDAKYTRHRYMAYMSKDRVFDRLFNVAISQLYSAAFGGYDFQESLRYPGSHVVVESKDLEKIDWPHYYRKLSSSTETQEWAQKNCYSYTLVLPENTTDTLMRYRIIQRDLTAYFGYKGSVQKRNIKCLVLKAHGEFKVASKGGTAIADVKTYGTKIQNYSIKFFLEQIQPFINGLSYGAKKRYMPYINETGYNGNIDLAFNVENISDLKLVNAALQEHNLELAVEDREIDVVVISD